MKFVSTELLKPNMRLAEDIYLQITDTFDIPLIRKGQILNDIFINKIKFHDIPGVYIEEDNYNFNNKSREALVEEQIQEIYQTVGKNFNSEKNNRGEVNVDLSEKIEKIVKSLIKEVISDKQVLLNLADLRIYDKYTFRHSVCVAILSIATGYALNLNKKMLIELTTCALLHDVGKMGVPIEIITKPDLLTPEEYAIIKRHPLTAVEILSSNGNFSQSVLDGIEAHHEKYDGSGYPYGKYGKDIPLYSKILAVADVYDALTSTRSYRRACFPSEAVEYIMGCADVHFDYHILNAFLENITAFKSGTFVTLSNGKIAVVVKGNSDNVLRPIVRLLYDDNSASQNIDLAHDPNYMNVTIVGMGYENPHFSYSYCERLRTC